MKALQYPTHDHIKKVTPLRDEKTIQGFLETLIWLDAGAPQQFDGLKGKYKFNIQEIISRTVPKEHRNIDVYSDAANELCGTVCCIGGAINMYRADGDFWKGSSLGLFSLESMDRNLFTLFYPVGRKHPKTAARVVRHYLFTGTVDWEIKRGKRYNV